MTLGAQIAWTGMLLLGIPLVTCVALYEPGGWGSKTLRLIGRASFAGTVASAVLLGLSMIWGF